ncbi:Ger(x)C family spore germination protein [Salicibibacter kimchii]|uniref:Ger(X)C family spore germination protein n=1 Tax=Salicibibacter kimchii TaxID=2099786 RepID=A0A345BZH4_9BACI|nr:Ger(x)C family spore germination protein [Salicibibacter kimchii]AXF56355.1 Ger(x)C family spore germination protein [Salicibibacter kimchii]
MKRVSIRTIVFLLFFPLLLTGCWDSEDIENRANVLAMAIDEAEPGAAQEEGNISHLEEGETEPPSENMINVTVQIAVPGEVALGPPQGGAQEAQPVWVLSTVGHSLEDAISNLQQEISDQIFLGQLQVVVVNEDVAKQGVDRFNETLRRNPQVRRNAWMVVSKETASQYMDISPALEEVPTLYLANMIENSVRIGKFPEDYMGLFWRMVSSKGQDGYLPYLELKGEEQIQLNGIAYFKGDEMVDNTDPIEIGAFMGIIGFEDGGYDFFAPVPDSNAHVMTEAALRQSNIETTIADGKPQVDVTIRYEFIITEKTGSEDITLDDEQVIADIEKEGRKATLQASENLIEKLQDEQSDIFGFGEYVRAKHPIYWNREIESKEKWQEEFQDLDVNVDIIYNIRRIGSST